MGRILIIEDDEHIADMYRNVQFMPGLETKVAPHGQGVMSIVQEFKPDVCVIDLCLPGESGVSIAKKISECYPDIGLLAVSGYIDQWSEDELSQAGFDEMRDKPIDVYELRTIIIKLIRKYNCPCNYNLCLPKPLENLPAEMAINKSCTKCGKHWESLQDIHSDSEVVPIGYCEEIKEDQVILFLNHTCNKCGTTLTLEIPTSAIP